MLEAIEDATARENIRIWLEGFCSASEKTALFNLIEKSPQEAIDAFYKNLEFGTGGIRGLVGIGTNRINSFTIQSAAQGLVNYMLKLGIKNPSIMVGYDNRVHSREFAEDAARVFAGNGFKVYLLKNLRPTPYLSFSMRRKNCTAGCMITASHNPWEYNGFKIYWDDGAQVSAPHDSGIIDEFKKIKNREAIKSVNLSLIEEIEEDSAYIKAVMDLQCLPKNNQEHGKDLKIVYTSLHGTGLTLLPAIFKKMRIHKHFFSGKSMSA